MFVAVFAASDHAGAARTGEAPPVAPFAPRSEQPTEGATARRVDAIPAAGVTSTSPGAGVTPTIPAEEFIRGYILVKPKAGLPRAAFDRALAAHGGSVIGELDDLGIYVVSLPPSASEKAVAHALSQHPHIKFAEPDALVRGDFVPNDTYYTSEWHLQTLDAPSAWNVANGTGVTVAILDSGIDATHPDLANQLVPGWNFWDNNSNTADVYGHGTKVAGVVAAAGNNSMGVAGIAFGARLMPVRVTDINGYASISALGSGLTYAADHGARVANMSFAVQSYSTVQSAAQYFMNKGGVVMNSAGNSGVLDSTAASSSLVSVAATDSTDTRASFSTYGPYVDLAAPGVGVWTTTMGGGYGGVSGTSFSSPLTAGVAAVVMSANPKLTPSQIVSLLESTAVDLGGGGYDTYYGYGRVSAGKAVAAATAGTPSDTQAPTVSIASPAAGTVSGIVNASVNASDNVGVTRVELLVNGASIGSDTTSPYAFAWDSSALAGNNASLVARAYDAAGNVATSNPVTVSVAQVVAVDSTPPAVAIASPTGGSVNGVVSVSVNASDNVGVASVQLLVNGNVLATDTNTPFTFSWDTSSFTGTNVTLSARAYDAAGNSATSVPVTVSVATSTPTSGVDSTPPVVTITGPTNGQKVNGMVNINASATDNVGVATLTLLIDGVAVGSSDRSTMSYKWNAKNATLGPHTITAVARDTSGNQATRTIQVTR